MDMAQQNILANLIARKARETPDFPVLTFVTINDQGAFEEEYRDYQTLWQQGQKIASALKEEGTGKGDRFALLMNNHPEFVDAMVGSSIVGTVYVPVDPRTRGDKLVHMLSYVECQGVICTDYTLEQLLQVADRVPSLRWAWVIGGDELPVAGNLKLVRLSDVLPDAEQDLPVAVTDPDDIMQMLYTSGTTGDPKAIEASYNRYASVASMGEAIGLQVTDRPYTGLSLSHANAQLISLGNMLYGGLSGVISRKFTKSRLWDICRHYGCTMFNLLGGMTTAIYSEPPRADDQDNPVRYVLSAGMPAPIWNQFRERFGLEVFEFYGAAEGGFTFNPPGAGPVGSIGKPPPTLEARILDEAGNECEPGVPGEIVFRGVDGSPLSVTYFGNPEASAKKCASGWLRMGDTGRRDEDGWLYFDCRMGSGIRRNGDFVSASYIEKVIAEDPAVDDVFVYGIPAANGVPGEKDVVAAVVQVEGASLDPGTLFQRCRAELEANLVPSFVQKLQAIPKTASEKPQEHFCLQHMNEHPENIFTEKPAQQELLE